MRWICWTSALLAAGVMGSSAAAAQFGCSGCAAPMGCSGCEQYGTLAAPACASSFYGWTPGCCEWPPSPCDNAWATYCCEKAKWRSFWYRVGSGVHLQRPMPVAYSPPIGYQALPSDEMSIPGGYGVPDVPVETHRPVESQGPSGYPPVPRPIPDPATWRTTYPRRG